MLIHASWIAGTAFTSEQPTEEIPGFPSSGVNGLKQGWGTTYRIPAKPLTAVAPVYWFHVAIPTPVIAEGRGLFIDKAFVLFKTEDGGTGGPIVEQVGLWDGGQAIASFRNFQEAIFGGGVHGDYSTLKSTPQSTSAGYTVRAFSNTFLPRTPDGKRIHPQFGVNISVGVHGGSQGKSLNICFFGAGIDFVDTET